MCVTDSNSSTPSNVLWFVNGVPVNDTNYGHIKNTRLSDRGQKIRSALNLTATREMNKSKVKCALGNDDTNMNEHILNVICKYMQNGKVESPCII